MRGQLSYLQGNLSLLQEMNWIDRQTRAVFAEFSVYNPNINLVMVSTILVEFLPSGSLLATAQFDPLNLFSDISVNFSFKVIAEIFFVPFIVYFMVLQIIECVNSGLREYIRDFWFIIEWSIIGTAFISVIMFVLRLSAANQVLNFFKNTGGYGYIKLQHVNNYNQILTYCLGLCASLSSIKSLKMLRFNKNISILGLTLKECFVELISFSFVFFIVWIAFVQAMYILFNNNLSGYISLTKSMSTAFEIMLGKFDVTQYQMANSILGPIVFSAYNAVILFFALNIFISIIIESFDKVRMDAKNNPNKFGFLDHIVTKIKKLFRKKEHLPSHQDYKNHLSVFSNHVDKLIHYLIKVNLFLTFHFCCLSILKLSERIWINQSNSNSLKKTRKFLKKVHFLQLRKIEEERSTESG